SFDWRIVGVADINGDGNADLVWYNATLGQAAVWFLNGFTMLGGGLVGPATDRAWAPIGVGDVNGDGKGNLVWRHNPTGQVATWLLSSSTVIGTGIVGTLSLNWQPR